MNCDRCGSIMISKRFCDYGGYSNGWKCILCGEIIDQIQENPQWLKIGRDQDKIGRRHYVMTYSDGVGFEWAGM
jgi:tRNA(Ile2) C34 agmatinyltransferase TiaS